MKALRRILYIAAVALALCFSFGCAAAGYTVFENARVFSDDIIFSAQIMGGRASYAHSRMIELLDCIDKQVSLSHADSDLAMLNAAGAGERVQVGEHTYELFRLSLEYYELTNGAFNCAITPLTELWGVNSGSYGQNGGAASSAIPTLPEIEQAKAHCDPRTVTASAEDGKYYLTKTDGEVRLDFGGIAKGYAVDKCVEILDEYDIRSALIDISGNAYFYGKNVSSGKEGDWSVGVVNPRPRGGVIDRGYVAAVSLPGDISAVTSGDYMRYRTAESGGETVYIPHIISPNGMPVGVEQKDGVFAQAEEWVISATIIGSSSALCDALGTAVAALGLEAGGELLQKTGHKGLIFTEKRYTIIGEIPLYKPEVYDGFTEYAYYER